MRVADRRTRPLGPCDTVPGDGSPIAPVRDVELPRVSKQRYEESRSLYYSGVEALEREDPHEAIDCLVQSCESAVHTKTAYRLAVAYHASGREFDALQAAGLAYGLNPRDNQAAIYFARLLDAAGESERAWWIAVETLHRNPDYQPATRLLNAMEAK